MFNSATPWAAACQAPLSSTISQSMLKFMSIESVMLSHSLILCLPYSFCLWSFPALESFPMSQLFPSVDFIRPKKSLACFRLSEGLISLKRKGFSSPINHIYIYIYIYAYMYVYKGFSPPLNHTYIHVCVQICACLCIYVHICMKFLKNI